MTRATITQWRLHSQRIPYTTFEQPHEAVAWLGAMQGQDYAGAKWAVGLRLVAGSDAGVERALAEGSIVRTWALRGTLHLVATTDLRWLVALIGQRQLARNARRYGELGLDAATLAHSSALLVEVLQESGQLSRRQLLAILDQHGVSTEGQRGVYMLQHASLEGLICQGTAPNNTPIFQLIDGPLADGPLLGRAEALAELARRYFASRGPATLQDFVWWSGLAVSDARAGLAAVAPLLREQSIDGQLYWMGQEQPPIDEATAALYLLPAFDEYLIGYCDRRAALDPAHADKIVPGGNGIFFPIIVSNGAVVGTWKRMLTKRGVAIAPAPFAPLSEAECEGLEAAAARVGRFLGLPAAVVSS